jgi:uncharacterized protein (UPF0297 family)
MSKDNTIVMSAENLRKEHIRHVLSTVADLLKERGYNSVNQLAGYLISNDPAYISSYKGARQLIQEVERNDLIEELLMFYLNSK